MTTYATWQDLGQYCTLSADPIGLLVLQIFGLATPQRVAWSDEVCTALQVIEHLQDVGEDAAAGRVYLPQDVLDRPRRRHAVTCSPPSASPALRAAVAEVGARARALLVSGGPPLVASLHGRPRWAVAGFCAGGHAALDAIERAGNDVLARATKPRPVPTLTWLGRLVVGSHRPNRTKAAA